VLLKMASDSEGLRLTGDAILNLVLC